ncbi:MAG: FHA domain-containing protein [Planctomycetes bacterium]|nr:FHA domain-containing protein [Planctomycetota bacterium]
MAHLLFRNGPYAGKSLQIPAGKMITIGRNRDIELPLPDLKLSRRHCGIDSRADGCYLVDMGSTNGTYINGERLSGDIRLKNFDRVLIGDTEIEYQAPEDIDELQTRVGMPAPETQATDENAAGSIPLNMPGAAAPQPINLQDMGTQPGAMVAAEMQPISPDEAAMALKDEEFRAALAEMNRALPPPPGSQPAPVAAVEPFKDERPQLLFCDVCNGSIPILDLDLGEAKEIRGTLICKECLARGVTIGDQVRASTPASGAHRPAQSITQILSGLDHVEEVKLGDQKAAQAALTPDEQAILSGGHSTRRQAPVHPRPAAGGPPPAPVPQKDLDDLLGDDFEEFEELGAPDPEPPRRAAPPVQASRPPAPAPRPAPAKAAPPKPAPRSASPFDEDEDLVEIGGDEKA